MSRQFNFGDSAVQILPQLVLSLRQPTKVAENLEQLPESLPVEDGDAFAALLALAVPARIPDPIQAQPDTGAMVGPDLDPVADSGQEAGQGSENLPVASLALAVMPLQQGQPTLPESGDNLPDAEEAGRVYNQHQPMGAAILTSVESDAADRPATAAAMVALSTADGDRSAPAAPMAASSTADGVRSAPAAAMAASSTADGDPVLYATGGGKQRGVGFTFVPPGATVDEASRQGSAHQSPESVKSETVAKDRPRISALNHAAVAIGLSPEDAEVRTTLKQVALTTGPSARVAQLEGQSTATAVVSSEAVLKERFKQVPQTDHSAVSSMSGRISNPGQDTERLPAVSPQPLTMGEVSPATVKPLQHEMLSELNTATSPDSKTNVPVSAQAGTPGHPTAAGFASTGADVSALETTVVGAGSSGDLAVTEKPRWLDQTLGRLSSMVANGEQRAELQLSPDHLGELEIHVKTRDNQASVLISASEASVREALASELERLRSLLSAGGYDSVDIELTTQSDHREPQHRQRHEHLNRASTGMFLASASEDAHGPGVEDRDLGSERLLSIYA